MDHKQGVQERRSKEGEGVFVRGLYATEAVHLVVSNLVEDEGFGGNNNA